MSYIALLRSQDISHIPRNVQSSSHVVLRDMVCQHVRLITHSLSLHVC